MPTNELTYLLADGGEARRLDLDDQVSMQDVDQIAVNSSFHSITGLCIESLERGV